MPAETVLAGLVAGRRTKMKPKRLAATAEAGAGDDGTVWPPERSLRVLQEVVARIPMVRFGGHSTIGLGRARFQLVAGRETKQERHP